MGEVMIDFGEEMKELITKGVEQAMEKAMEAVRQSLAEWAMERETKVAKHQEAPFNTKQDEHITLQALKLTSGDEVEGIANRPRMTSSGLIVSPGLSPEFSPCINPDFVDYAEWGKRIGWGGPGQMGIGFGVDYMPSGSGGGPGDSYGGHGGMGDEVKFVNVVGKSVVASLDDKNSVAEVEDEPQVFEKSPSRESTVKSQAPSPMIDTVVIGESGPEGSTPMSSKAAKDVLYSLGDEEDDEEEEKERLKANSEANGADPNAFKTSLRSLNQESTKEELRRQHQAELARQKNEETTRRLTGGDSGIVDNRGSVKSSGDIVAYKNVNDLPPSRGLVIQIDQKNEAILLPMYGSLVPFHVATVKNVTSQKDTSRTCYIRIIFNVPGTPFSPHDSNTLKFQGSIYVKELSFRSRDPRHSSEVVQLIKTLRRQVVSWESERAERATLVSQEKLQVAGAKFKPIRLSDLWIRPVFGGRARKLSGSLEAHTNGFRYSTSRAEERVDVIMYANIKHTFFQPAEKEMITLLHFHLHNHIMVGNKKTKDVQFNFEVMDVAQTIGGGKRSAYDPDDIEEEQRERAWKNKINLDFQNFVNRVNDLWGQPQFKSLVSDLHQVIKANDNLTPGHHQFFLYQLLRALKYIHTGHVFHRDFKPKNILANADCKLKICDFRPARASFDDAPSAICWTDYVATRWYRAPECCGSFFAKYTPAVDIWSIGCIIAQVLTGKPLFPGKNMVQQRDLVTDLLGTPPAETIARIRNEKAKRYLSSMRKKSPIPFSQEFPNADPLALRLLAFDHQNRPSAEEALANPYFYDLALGGAVGVLNTEFVVNSYCSWSRAADSSKGLRLLYGTKGNFLPITPSELNRVSVPRIKFFGGLKGISVNICSDLTNFSVIGITFDVSVMLSFVKATMITDGPLDFLRKHQERASINKEIILAMPPAGEELNLNVQRTLLSTLQASERMHRPLKYQFVDSLCLISPRTGSEISVPTSHRKDLLSLMSSGDHNMGSNLHMTHINSHPPFGSIYGPTASQMANYVDLEDKVVLWERGIVMDWPNPHMPREAQG